MLTETGTSAAIVVPPSPPDSTSQPAAEQGEALAHADEPEAAVACVGRVEALSVVLDHCLDRPRAFARAGC